MKDSFPVFLVPLKNALFLVACLVPAAHAVGPVQGSPTGHFFATGVRGPANPAVTDPKSKNSDGQKDPQNSGALKTTPLFPNAKGNDGEKGSGDAPNGAGANPGGGNDDKALKTPLSEAPNEPIYPEQAGPDFGAGYRGGYTSNYGAMKQAATDGRMEPCDNAATGPTQVRAAFEQALKFRAACSLAKRDNQKIAINDYSGNNSTPYMYIFDTGGKCLGKTAVTYGSGLGAVAPQACADDGSHLTPPGFHLTCYHEGSYSAAVSLGMCGLEGQQSQSRGILIHPARRPGTASSHGCSGVGSFDEVKRRLGYGSLVYNYFGNKSAAGNCRSQAGMSHATSCRLDAASPAIPGAATGEPSNSAR